MNPTIRQSAETLQLARRDAPGNFRLDSVNQSILTGVTSGQTPGQTFRQASAGEAIDQCGSSSPARLACLCQLVKGGMRMTSRRFDSTVRDARERGTARQPDIAGPAPKHAAQHDATARIPPAVAAAPGPGAPAAALVQASGGSLARAGRTLLQLQRQRGNRYVQQVVDHAHQATTAPPVIQAKLVLGPPVDRYEREADRVARQVLQGATSAAGVDGGRVLRMPGIQRVHSADVGVVDANVQQAIQGARGGGRPLPDQVRGSMEAALGADLGGVRLHTDARADWLACSLQARAFTTGRDIFFRRGQDNPSSSGRQVLAHELTHVVQQGGGSLQHPGTVAQRLPSASQVSNIIQRRMGFEFETTAHVRGTFHRSFEEAGQGSFEDFKHAKEFYRPAQGRWKIVPDTRRIEFVTDPLTTLQELQAVTGEVEAFINSLQNVERRRNIREIHPGGTWTAPSEVQNEPRVQNDEYTVHVGSGENFGEDVKLTDWYGQPQVSVGVLTHRVARFLHRARTTRPLSGLKEQTRQLIRTTPAQAPPMPKSLITNKIRDVSELMSAWTPTFLPTVWLSGASLAEVHNLVTAHAGNLPSTDQDKLRGLWTLMKAYWVNLVKIKVAGSYKKSKLLAMARTDFHSFYNDLSPNAKLAFRDAKDTFAPPGDVRVLVGTNITLQRWYASIVQPEAGFTHTPEEGAAPRPVDLLSATESAGVGEGPFATGTDKSMGQYPLDVTGGRGQARAVFELRRLTPGARIPIRLMYDHVLRPIFNLVENVER